MALILFLGDAGEALRAGQPWCILVRPTPSTNGMSYPHPGLQHSPKLGVVGYDRLPSLIVMLPACVIWQSTLKCLIPSINICLDCRKFVCRYCLKASESPILMTRWEGILKIPAHTHTPNVHRKASYVGFQHEHPAAK